MLGKLKRLDTIKCFPCFPLSVYNKEKDDYDFHYPKSYAYYVLTLTSRSFKGHASLLATELSALVKEMGYEYLLFLGDGDTPWLYRNSEYKPAKEALQYLTDNKVGKRFNGALKVESSQLPTFLRHLAWLVRTNTVLPTVHFMDSGQGIVANICQYGNLHIATLTRDTDKRLRQVISTSRFGYQKDGNCYEKFSKGGGIKGRTVIV